MVYCGILWYTMVTSYPGCRGGAWVRGYTVVYCTVYLDDGLWVWQYQSEHSGGSSKQHHNMSTPDLPYTDVRQQRAHTSQDQLESSVREVCVQRDLQQTQHISLIMPVNEFEINVKWFKLSALSNEETACSRIIAPTSAVFMLGDYRNYHVALYTTASHSLPCQNVKLISCLHVYVDGFQMAIKHPTYGGQACDQEAALQRIFQVALTMPYFVPSCAKHRPLRK